MRKIVEIRTLPEGTSFEYRGRRGRLLRLSAGSAFVEIEQEGERTFVPQSGPNAGQTIRIKNANDRVTWSLASPVTPIH